MNTLKEDLEKAIGQKLPESFAELVEELQPEDTTGENFELLKNLAIVGAGLGSVFMVGFDFGLLSGLTAFFGVKIDKTFDKMKSVLGVTDWALDHSVVQRYQKLKQFDVLLSYYAAFKALEKLEPEIKKMYGSTKDSQKANIISKNLGLVSIEFIGEGLIEEIHSDCWIAHHFEGSAPEIFELQMIFGKEHSLWLRAFQLHLSKEIPEFGLFTHQKEFEKITQICTKIADLQPLADSALALDGYKELGPDFPELQIYPQLTTLELACKGTEHREIKSYLGKIKRFAEDKLFKAKEVEDAAAPSCKEAYLPQAYEKITYNPRDHRDFFEQSTWDKLDKKSGPKVSYVLFQSLLNPKNSKRPILLLGNPGSGKSMTSRLLAAKLLEQPGFIPFWIPLKKVDSNHVEIKEHISKGIAYHSDVMIEIDWKNWVAAFPERIPVFILDGLDELLLANEIDLNAYLIKVEELQKSIFNDGISARFIVTSRLTVMDRLSIPEGTEIIKLSPFSRPKQEQWCKRWNKFQSAAGKKTFSLPEEVEGQKESQNSIAELSQEPLILFLLAIYNSGGGDLAHLAKHGGRANLYNELIKQFTARQILKDNDEYSIHNPPKTKGYNDKCQTFRLTLGVAAFLMYRLDRTDLKPRELFEGTKFFEIPEDQEADDFFRGFFFLHQNNSQGKEDEQKWNFEFIHKTFGEYLAADFMLSVVQAQGGREYVSSILEDEKALRVVMGYQWLTKHPKILSFLLEIASTLSLEAPALKVITKTIKKELKRFQSGEEWPFPISDFQSGAPYSKIEHFARYSQNLILLWLGLNGAEELKFNLFEGNENQLTEKPAVEMSRAIGREGAINDNPAPQTKNLQYWQQISQLWKMIGGNNNLQALAFKLEAKHQNGEVCFNAYPKGPYGSPVPFKQNLLLDFDLVDKVSLRGIDTLELLKRSPELTYDILWNLQFAEPYGFNESGFYKEIWELYPIEEWAGPLAFPLRRLIAKAPSQWASFLKKDKIIPNFFKEHIKTDSNKYLFYQLIHHDCFAEEDLDLVLDAYRTIVPRLTELLVENLVELCKLQAQYPNHQFFKEPWFNLHQVKTKKRKYTRYYFESLIYLEAYNALAVVVGPLLYGILENLAKTEHHLSPLEQQQVKCLQKKYQKELEQYKHITKLDQNIGIL